VSSSLPFLRLCAEHGGRGAPQILPLFPRHTDLRAFALAASWQMASLPHMLTARPVLGKTPMQSGQGWGQGGRVGALPDTCEMGEMAVGRSRFPAIRPAPSPSCLCQVLL
jgi:hypothetical protein